MTRVIKKVDVIHSYALVGDDKFHQFPDMSAEIYVPFKQFVKVKYQIVNAIPGDSFLVTRAMFDGVENR